MAVKTSCSYCKKSFSAPEEYRGKKVECPSCGRRFILRSEEDIHAVHEQAEAAKKKREEDKEKLALIEKIESRQRKSSIRRTRIPADENDSRSLEVEN